jgi:YHS domain-containing protein
MNKILLVLSFLLAATTVDADTLQYATDRGAIDGYDTVSYFTNGRPERGNPNITAEWNGVEWHFVSQEHRDAFIENPQKYAPEYGGFCALGMAHGGDVPTNPEAWTIWNGKLYLNMIDEVRTTWLYSPDKLIERAGRKWQAINSVEQ